MASLTFHSPSQNPLPANASTLTELSSCSRHGANYLSACKTKLWEAGLLGILFCLIHVAAFGQSLPVMISPAPGSILGSSTTFTWTAAAGATKYTLYLGTQGVGSSDLYASAAAKATSVVVSGLPQQGVTVYARLSSFRKGVWQYADYTYIEASLAPSLSSLSCSSNSITGASNDACTITLSAAANTGGFTVGLTSSNAAVVVPASVIVLAGASTASFTATVSAVTITQSAALTASANGVSKTFAIQLNPVQATLSSISCTNLSMTGAGTDSCVVTLSGPATGSGFVVNLSSNNSAVTVPASITVPANASNGAFSAAISAVNTAQTATLTASAGGVSRTFAIQLVTATPTLNINATTISFGNVTLNTTATQSITLSSAGTAAVTVNSATLTGAGFSLSGMSFPTTLNPGQNAVLNVAFTPATSGTASGTLTLSSNSSTNPSTKVTLSGTGVAASYQVNLAWIAPASSPDPVAGYNIYRAASGTGAYQLLNSSPDVQVNYIDSTIKNGQSYDYEVKSVDASGVESAPSNVTTSVIP